eukprot:TRINITY_DN9933_c0_g1_i1.p1 TRINITY_DN9933_c0_g1~~TRINITY_DN9933_c0_g1_i1.p1  ORF type:complete len:213 (+),score=17.18 TRINITY_DN9933_c0_g1_i1:155-793(+)
MPTAQITTVLLFQVTLQQFLLYSIVFVGASGYSCGERSGGWKKDRVKQQILLQESSNKVARYLICSFVSDQESCQVNDDVEYSCTWNQDNRSCQMNYESFLQFVMDCEDIQDHSNNSNNLQGSVEIQLACDTITAISRCMIDKNEQLDILQLFQCELQKSETDFCTGADDVEIGLMTAKNQTQLQERDQTPCTPVNLLIPWDWPTIPKLLLN